MTQQKPRQSSLLLKFYWGSAALFLLLITGFWYLLFGPVLTVTAFYRAIQNPLSEVSELHMDSSYYNRFSDNHSFWFTFRSNRAIKLKDMEDYSEATADDARERTKFGPARIGCKKFLGRNRDTFVLLSPQSAAKETYADWDTGRIFVHNRAMGIYCFQSWYYYG